jgi:hypothetical protein
LKTPFFASFAIPWRSQRLKAFGFEWAMGSEVAFRKQD